MFSSSSHERIFTKSEISLTDKYLLIILQKVSNSNVTLKCVPLHTIPLASTNIVSDTIVYLYDTTTNDNKIYGKV